jgi:hypothetical protein
VHVAAHLPGPCGRPPGDPDRADRGAARVRCAGARAGGRAARSDRGRGAGSRSRRASGRRPAPLPCSLRKVRPADRRRRQRRPAHRRTARRPAASPVCQTTRSGATPSPTSRRQAARNASRSMPLASTIVRTSAPAICVAGTVAPTALSGPSNSDACLGGVKRSGRSARSRAGAGRWPSTTTNGRTFCSGTLRRFRSSDTDAANAARGDAGAAPP